MKKIIAVAALSMASAASNAQVSNFTGFSGVVNLNAVSVNSKTTFVDDIDGTAIFDGTGQQSWNGSLQAAYGFDLSPSSVISIGATYGLGKSKAGMLSFGDGAFVSKANLKNQLSIYVEPGYLVADKTMIYGKIGYESGKLVGTVNDSGDITSGSVKVKGSSFGFGVRTMVSKTSFIQAEVRQVGYKSKETFEGIFVKPKALVGTIGFGMKF
jgi:hypothetical protein